MAYPKIYNKIVNQIIILINILVKVMSLMKGHSLLKETSRSKHKLKNSKKKKGTHEFIWNVIRVPNREIR